MLFDSYAFIFAFLPVTVATFWWLRGWQGHRASTLWLLLASIVFYTPAGLKSLALVTPSILIDYVIARGMLSDAVQGERTRRWLFVLGVTLNVLLLCYFKYRNFFLETASTLLAEPFDTTPAVLPLGISFLVFQKIAFLADVRSGEVRQVTCIDFLLFAFFFPRMIAGPIVHYNEVSPQFSASPRHPGVDVMVGAYLFSIGLFKKTIIADGLGQFVLLALGPPGQPQSAYLPHTAIYGWMGLLAYTLQLYFDFSGYSDMALGAARMVGIRLPMNFNSPFKATSMVDFWNRWHITLTRVLTVYVYTPIALHVTRLRLDRGRPVLRGQRSDWSAIASLIVFPTLTTMAVSGLWHGAGWQFLVWGLLHGIYLSINQVWRLFRPRFWPDQSGYENVMKPLGRLVTLLSVVVALVFFRAASVDAALPVLRSLIEVPGDTPGFLQAIASVGVTVEFPALHLGIGLPAFWYLTALLIAVMVMPNSLELLRRFEPALDFPRDTAAPPTCQPAPLPPATAVVSMSGWLRAQWIHLAQIGHLGVDLSPVTAGIAALLCTLGVTAIGPDGGFIYGQF